MKNKNKNVDVYMPKYLKSFKCIGGNCEDNCCIGWAVDFDLQSYNRYKSTSDLEIKPLVNRYVYQNEACFNTAIDFAKVELTKDKRCPFLDTEGLCVIQKKLGEKALSNVCTLYPRIVNIIDQYYEVTATPSCPEIARKLLLDKEAMIMVNEKRDGKFPVITYDVKDNQIIKVRNHVIKMLTDVTSDFEDRLVNVFNYLLTLYPKKSNAPSVKAIKHIMSVSEVAQHEKQLRAMLAVNKNVDSIRFKKFLSNMKALGDGNNFNTYFNEKNHVLSNYFANDCLQNIFPFSDSDDLLASFYYLLCRYIMIKAQLMSLAHELNDVMVVDYIQSFSKVIDHHNDFKVKAIAYMKKSLTQA